MNIFIFDDYTSSLKSTMFRTKKEPKLRNRLSSPWAGHTAGGASPQLTKQIGFYHVQPQARKQYAMDQFHGMVLKGGRQRHGISGPPVKPDVAYQWGQFRQMDMRSDRKKFLKDTEEYHRLKGPEQKLIDDHGKPHVRPVYTPGVAHHNAHAHSFALKWAKRSSNPWSRPRFSINKPYKLSSDGSRVKYHDKTFSLQPQAHSFARTKRPLSPGPL